MIGRRDVCKEMGQHEIQTLTWIKRSNGQPVLPPDNIKCERCDAVFTVTYPEIGTEIEA